VENMKSLASGNCAEGLGCLQLRAAEFDSRTEPTFNQMRTAVNAPAITRRYHVANALSLLSTMKYVEF
jgi:hypothetical protein